ncbi:hypothetical protein HZY88_06140 [Aerococcaceae bacterium DSM 111176]|nr:hypothetical protein [Aerococcaceae bacterium DSM 111176]
MYAALNESGKLYYASELNLNSTSKWYCPNCREQVRLSISNRGKLYFKHLRKPSQTGGGESSEHLKVKNDLIEYFQQQKLHINQEVSFNSIDRIADIVLSDLSLIIEIQHTPISSNEIRKRTKAYNQLGYRCIWLMTTSLKNLTKHHQWQQVLMQHNDELDYFRVFYDNGIKLQWGYEVVNRGVLNYFEYHSDNTILLNFDASAIKRSSVKQTHSHSLGTSRINYHKRMRSLKKDYSSHEFIMKLYEAGVRLDDIPQWIIMERCFLFGIKTLPWKFLTLIWIRKNQSDQSVELIIKNLILEGEVEFMDLPFISRERWLNDLAIGISKLFEDNQA